MIILGSKPGQHDACFALIRDGVPLFVYEQERFNRVKHGMSAHVGVLFQGLEDHRIDPSEIDLVTNCIDPSRLPGRKAQVRTYLRGDSLDAMERYLDWRLPTWHRLLTGAGFPEDRVLDVRHHICHAAGVFYASPFDDAAILSVDGSGETETAMLAHGGDNGIEVLRTTPHPHSLGHLYQAATFWLGWGFGEEGKTMALAGYGDRRRFRSKVDEIISVDADGQFRLAPIDDGQGRFAYSSEELATTVFPRLFGPRRAVGDDLRQTHMDLAAAVQWVCEEVMVRSARYLRCATGSRRLLLAGGVGLNSVSNGRIVAQGLFDDVVAYPQANDAGTALGGALWAYHRLCEAPRRWHMTHPYLGRMIDVEHVDSAASRVGVVGVRVEAIHEQVADLLAAGSVVGWIQGRAEIGPRALGNRSILANPLRPGVKDLINARVKHREWWRPFAPSVLREDLEKYFEADQHLPYMTIVAPIREGWRGALASIGHVDGTARVQTVTAESNPAFHALLRAFRERTGLGLLLNTSFNDRGEPLVQTCQQALRLFVASEMDALAIEDRLFTDKQGAGPPAAFSPISSNVDKLPPGRLLLIPSGRDPEHLVPVLQAVARARPDLHIAVDPASPLLACLPAGLPPLLRPARQVERDLEGGSYDGVVFCVDRPADAFVFDGGLYWSELADQSRRLLEDHGVEVHWIDIHGDVVPMRDLLYLHHDPTRRRAVSPYPRHTGTTG